MFLRKLLSLTKFTVVAVVATLVSVAANSATACNPPCYFKKVVTYVNQQEPYQVSLTKHDELGKPYQVYITHYRTVSVPVVKWVKVCY